MENGGRALAFARENTLSAMYFFQKLHESMRFSTMKLKESGSPMLRSLFLYFSTKPHVSCCFFVVKHEGLRIGSCIISILIFDDFPREAPWFERMFADTCHVNCSMISALPTDLLKVHGFLAKI